MIFHRLDTLNILESLAGCWHSEPWIPEDIVAVSIIHMCVHVYAHTHINL